MGQRLIGVALALLVFSGCNFKVDVSESTEEPKPQTQDNLQWPTEAEAREAMLRVENSIHASPGNREIYQITDFHQDVHTFKFANAPIEKFTGFADASVVFPAHVTYSRIYEHRSDPTKVEEVSGTWFFFKDQFGEWTGQFTAD